MLIHSVLVASVYNIDTSSKATRSNVTLDPGPFVEFLKGLLFGLIEMIYQLGILKQAYFFKTISIFSLKERFCAFSISLIEAINSCCSFDTLCMFP